MAKLVPALPSPRGERLYERLTFDTAADRNTMHTTALHNELRRAVTRSATKQPDRQNRLATRLTASALRDRTFPTDVRRAIEACARALIQSDQHLFELPAVPLDGDPLQQANARTLMRQRLNFFANEEQRVANWITHLSQVMNHIGGAVRIRPATPCALSIPLPLVSLVRAPAELIARLVKDFVSLAPETPHHSTRPGTKLAEQVVQNLLLASQLTREDAEKRPHRLKWPESGMASPTQLLKTYLANTPFVALFETIISVPVPHRIRYEHCHFLARIGHGKSQGLQHILLSDFEDPTRPSVVVIDSQGDMIRTLSRLKQFDPNFDDRLIVLDPSDVQFPLALNLFHVDREHLKKLSPAQREEFLAGATELFDWLLGGLLGAELTPKMSVVFRFLSQLLIEIPDSTIHTLKQLLHDPTPFMHYVDRLPQTAKDFIANHLYEAQKNNQYNETRKQILRRLFHVLSNPTFERMFGHPENKFDMSAALDNGKVVLVNTAKAHLKAEWSAIFGRYCIALVMQAAFKRALIPERQRHPAFLVIDEASEYFDNSLDTLLIQARKYKIGITAAHQTMDQITSPTLRASLIGMPAIRFTGDVSHADASLLAPEMRSTADFLSGVRKTEAGAEWAVHVRNLTPTASVVPLPYFRAENAPKMSTTAYVQLLKRIRGQVSAPPAEHHQTGDIPIPPNNNGDSY